MTIRLRDFLSRDEFERDLSHVLDRVCDAGSTVVLTSADGRPELVVMSAEQFDGLADSREGPSEGIREEKAALKSDLSRESEWRSNEEPMAVALMLLVKEFQWLASQYKRHFKHTESVLNTLFLAWDSHDKTTTQARARNILRIQDSTFTAMLRRMEADGLVTVDRRDKSNRIKIAPKGEMLIEEAHTRFVQLATVLFEGFSPASRETMFFFRNIRRVRQNLEKVASLISAHGEQAE